MRQVLTVTCAVLLGCSALHAQLEDNFCPGGDSLCSDDFLGITFEVASPQGTDFVEVTGDNCFAYGAFEAGTRIGSVLTMKTVSGMVQGYSLAVTHDESLLSITDDDLTVDNTDTGANEGGFPFRNNKVVSGGYIVAEVLDISGGGALLPPVAGDNVNTLLRAYYTLNSEPPAEGTILRYANGELNTEGSPPVAVVVTDGGASLSPNKVTNAIILANCDVASAEVCDNEVDDNGNGLVDCDDPECDGDPACVVVPAEICDNEVDDNGNGLVDCDDPECADFLGCQPEICDNEIDDNGNGLIDCGDPQCDGDLSCNTGDCPTGNVLYFGNAATGDEVSLPGGPFPLVAPISARHPNDLAGVQLGVAIEVGSGSQSWGFSSEVGTTKIDGSTVMVPLLFAEDGGADATPSAGNTAAAATDAEVVGIERGAALLPLLGTGGNDLGDFLSFELDPDILPSGTSRGFTIGYVSDLTAVETISGTPDEAACPTNELFLVILDSDVVECPVGDVLVFGDSANGGDAAIPDGPLPLSAAISSRNVNPLFGVQLGVAISTGDNSQTWEFSNEVGSTKADGSQVIVPLIFVEEATDVNPAAGNVAHADTDAPVVNIERGSALLPLVGGGTELGDFLSFELDPDILPSGASRGFTIAYVSDVEAIDSIPATPDASACPVNELFLVTVDSDVGGAPFLRGDADGNGTHNVIDAVILLQVLAGSRAAPFPGCLDILDANGDGVRDVTDGTFLLDFIILRGAPVLPAPYPGCAAPAGTTCTESNCQL